MKTKIIILLLAITGIVTAQDNYMSLTFGVGNPLGDYASITSLTNSGYAIQGFMADYSGVYYPIDYVGIGGAIKFNQNAVDKKAVSEALLDLLPSEPEAEIESPVFDIGLWRIVAIGVGPQLTLPAGKLSFDGYIYPGLHVVMPPQMSLTAIVDGEPTKLSVEAQNLRFGFEAGLALRYKINSTTGLRLVASYLQTSSKGEILNDIAGDSEADFSTKIQMVNIGLGVYYRL